MLGGLEDGGDIPPSIRLLLLIGGWAPLTGDVGSCWLGSSATSSNLRLSRPLLPKKPSKDCCVCGVLLPPGDAINDDEQKMRLQCWRSARLKFRSCSFAPKAKEFLEFNLNSRASKFHTNPRLCECLAQSEHVVWCAFTVLPIAALAPYQAPCRAHPSPPPSLVMLLGTGVRYKFCSGSKRLRRRWCRCSC